MIPPQRNAVTGPGNPPDPDHTPEPTVTLRFQRDTPIEQDNALPATFTIHLHVSTSSASCAGSEYEPSPPPQVTHRPTYPHRPSREFHRGPVTSTAEEVAYFKTYASPYLQGISPPNFHP